MTTNPLQRFLFSIVGISLSMFAGGIFTIWLQAEANGELIIPYMTIYKQTYSEGLFILSCSKNIPYWETVIEDTDKNGYLAGRCTTLAYLKI